MLSPFILLSIIRTSAKENRYRYFNFKADKLISDSRTDRRCITYIVSNCACISNADLPQSEESLCIVRLQLQHLPAIRDRSGRLGLLEATDRQIEVQLDQALPPHCFIFFVLKTSVLYQGYGLKYMYNGFD